MIWHGTMTKEWVLLHGPYSILVGNAWCHLFMNEADTLNLVVIYWVLPVQLSNQTTSGVSLSQVVCSGGQGSNCLCLQKKH